MTDEKRDTFEGWAILELMGHRRLAGYVSEQQLAGGAFVRVDVPGRLHTEPTGDQEERDAATQFYSPAAVYCITPCAERLAREIAESARPRPVNEWDLPRRRELEASYADATGTGVDLEDTDGVEDADFVDHGGGVPF